LAIGTRPSQYGGTKANGGHGMPSDLSAGTLFILALYLLPAILAAIRRHHQRNAIFVLNLLLGWTVIGWIGALIWAATATREYY
jgi:hypothetical protein